MVYVTSDPHGHRVELVAGLQKAGLVNETEAWSGGESHLWVLGDLLDRGPDGLGVIDLVRRLQVEAEQAGGYVGALLGNHEVMALGMLRFGVHGTAPDADRRHSSVALTWVRNGGHEADQAGLVEDRLDWLMQLPALHVEQDVLLMHADSEQYLAYLAGPGGEAQHNLEQVNAGIAADLASPDIEAWQRLFHRLTVRHDFFGPDRAAAVDRVTSAFGVSRLVHGHSIIGDLVDIPVEQVTHPLLYADNRVLDIDGGIYAGGPCLVVDLDTWPDRSD